MVKHYIILNEKTTISESIENTSHNGATNVTSVTIGELLTDLTGGFLQ